MKLRQSGFSRAAAEALGSRAAVTKSVTAAIGGIGLSERVFTHPIDLHFFNIWGHLAGTFLEQLRVQDTITSFLKDSSKDFTFILLHLVSLQFIRQHFLWKNTDHLINNSSLSIFSPAHTHRTPSLVLGFIALNSSQRSIGFHNATLSRRYRMSFGFGFMRFPMALFSLRLSVRSLETFSLLSLQWGLVIQNLPVERHPWFSYQRTFSWNVISGSFTTEPSCGMSYLVLLPKNLLVEHHLWFSYYRTFLWNDIPGSLTKQPSLGTSSLVLLLQNLPVERPILFSYQRNFLWNVIPGSLTKEPSHGTSPLVFVLSTITSAKTNTHCLQTACRDGPTEHINVFSHIFLLVLFFSCCGHLVKIYRLLFANADFHSYTEIFKCIGEIAVTFIKVFLTSSENESDTDSEDKEMPLIAEGQQTK
ncbi:hypothetical protein F2P81_012435 [Scophthalmus maximus]|uniref:Uncharacterized protein n=1 Tax=Scophthalmus maximus TaxID=52904 RepID=A0A6A4SN96_SCOMX|nr:hypothetical protein F2P81_012435 [Scophthalmus maximus]